MYQKMEKYDDIRKKKHYKAVVYGSHIMGK